MIKNMYYLLGLLLLVAVYDIVPILMGVFDVVVFIKKTTTTKNNSFEIITGH